ncbi:MAG: hypothetical protein Pg6C_04640 [Treponemataceae bacterium]|nr:MAG: hypothetical protein Pg6C_04640 [Treponemataceae bacterium]
MKTKLLCVIPLLLLPRLACAQMGLSAGIDFSALLSRSADQGWELGALYPFVGLQTDYFRLSAFGGAGIALTEWGASTGSETINGISRSWDYEYSNWYGTLCFGGSIETVLAGFLLGCGFGYEYAMPFTWYIVGHYYEEGQTSVESKTSYPFIRASIGLGAFDTDGFTVKVYYDYRFGNHGNKYGILFGYVRHLGGYAPPPAPRPRPSPPPAPAPPPPVPVSGTVYYSYNGIGYVYISEGVFYLCSDGRPVGYTDAGVIFAFGGRVLGFYENAFIYDRNGNPVGADDPKRLGTDAAAKRSVTKASKQALPVKQPKQSVTRPRLKNGYFGGSLQDIF